MNENLQKLMERIKRGAEQAGSAVEKGVKTAGEKTGEFIESAKIGLHIAELQTREREVLRDIGGLVYAAHKDPNTDTEMVDGMLAELDNLHKEIGESRERQAEIKQRKVCPQCQAEVGRHDEFCRFCGRKLS